MKKASLKKSKTVAKKVTAKKAKSSSVKASKAKSSTATKVKVAFKSQLKRLNAAQRKNIRRADAIDQVILSLAAGPYGKIMKQIENGKKRLNDERRIALELGTRILSKAKEVRDSLIQRTRAARGD